MTKLKYLSAYPSTIQNQVYDMLNKETLSKYLLGKYPHPHTIVNDKALRNYTIDIKNKFLKKSSPLSKVKFDDKIHVINNALGLHSFVSRVQGSKLKSKNEIVISKSVFFIFYLIYILKNSLNSIKVW